MALEIHFAPVLTGETAERFIYEAENHTSRGPLTQEEMDLLDLVERKSKILKKELEEKHGIKL